MRIGRADVLPAVVVAAIQLGATAAAAHDQTGVRPFGPMAAALLVLSAAGLVVRRRTRWWRWR